MRTREMNYEDYGMDKKIVDGVREFYRKAIAENNKEHLEIIDDAFSEFDPYIARVVRKNLFDGISYEKICGQEYIYLGKQDFYGYCRQAIEKIDRWMMWNLIYKDWKP